MEVHTMLVARLTYLDSLHSSLDTNMKDFYTRVRPDAASKTHVLQQWLNTYEHLFQTQAFAYQAALKHSMQPLTSYFPRNDIAIST